MAATVAGVQEIFSTSLGTSIISRMLSIAEILITEHVDPVGVSDELRDELKMWIAAHFCSIRDRQVKERSADGVRFVFDGGIQEGKVGFESTFYGKQVLMLDSTGTLAKISSSQRKKLAFKFSYDQEDA